MTKPKNKDKKSVVFTMRMHPETKEKLESLASNKAFRFNNSAVICYLIDAEHTKIYEKL
jgi:hypothetical protein